MPYILSFVAALFSTAILVWRSPAVCVLSVYLPLFLLWPYGYGFVFKGVEIDALMAASIPLICASLWRYWPEWRFSFLDLLILLYPVSACASDWRTTGSSAGLVTLVSGPIGLWGVVPPYIVGKLLIDRHCGRVRFLRRMTALLCVVAMASIYEYRMESDPFRILASKVTGISPHTLEQLRWGFGRVTGPFEHAILAGIVFFAGLLFSLWLRAEGKWEPRFRRLSWLPGKKASWVVAGMLAGAWMTQSRGPWMGGAFGLVLLYAGRARNLRRSLLRASLLCLAIFTLFALITAHYTDESHEPQTQDQENAMYRRELIANYTPTVVRGGFFGWGLFFPRVPGQGSIDNEYLLVTLRQGYLGLLVFFAMIGNAGSRLVRTILRSPHPAEARFAFCLLAVLTSTALALTTVYMGAQVFTLFFLLLGWAQASAAPRLVTQVAEPLFESDRSARYAFRRVFC